MKTLSSLLYEVGQPETSKPNQQVITISSGCDLVGLKKEHWLILGGIEGFFKGLMAISNKDSEVVWKRNPEDGSRFADVLDSNNRTIRFVVKGNVSQILFVLSSLNDWFEGGEARKKDAIETLKFLADCPNRLPWYTSMTGDRVYRGIARPVTDVKKISLSDKTVKLTSSGDDFIVGKVAYDPRYEIQSWSLSKSIALGFYFIPMKMRASGVPKNQWILSFKPSKNEIVFGDQFTFVSGRGMLITSEREIIVAPKSGRELTVMISAMNLFYSIEDAINPLPPKGRRLNISDETRMERLTNFLGSANAKTLMKMKLYKDNLNNLFGF